MRLHVLISCALATAAVPVRALAYASVYAIGNFDGADGVAPAGVTLFGDGYLYGVAGEGPDPSNYGEIYRLDPVQQKIEVLYAFTSADGYFPSGKVVLGAGGQIYGVTQTGGAGGNGTVFAFNPRTGKLAVLHAFTVSEGGPGGGVVFGKDGKLYGVTQSQGSRQTGMIFRLDPVTAALTKLQSIGGYHVSDPLAVAPDGSLYGSSSYTNAIPNGVIFKMAPATGKFSVVHGFKLAEGAQATKIAIDSTGAIFVGRKLSGTAGDIVRFAPSTYAESVFTTFDSTNGSYPVGAMTFTNNGDVIGATATGGFSGGTLFQADAQTGALHTLYQYNTGFPAYEGYPVSDMITTRLGIFGTTSGGGAYQAGTVFQLKFNQ